MAKPLSFPDATCAGPFLITACDGSQTPVTEAQALALTLMGHVRYCPNCGPKGRTFHPWGEFTMADERGVRSWLATDD